MIDAQIKDSLTAFRGLGINNVYEVAKLQDWLLKYEALYESLITIREIEFDPDGSYSLDLLTDSERSFFWFYRDINRIVDASKYDSHCQTEMLQYHLIKNNITKLKAWLKRNYQLGIESLDAYRYLLDGQHKKKKPNLQVMQHSYPEMEINVDRKDFSNMLEFMMVCRELFYKQKILPEQLKAYWKAQKERLKDGSTQIPEELL